MNQKNALCLLTSLMYCFHLTLSKSKRYEGFLYYGPEENVTVLTLKCSVAKMKTFLFSQTFICILISLSVEELLSCPSLARSWAI